MKYPKIYQATFFLLILVFSSCQNGYYQDDFEDFEEDSFAENQGDYIEAEADNDFAILTSYNIQGDEINKIKDYNVKNKYLNDQQDYLKHLAMWEYFTTLIPIEHRTYFSEFLVIHGEGDLGGYVEPIKEGDLSQWRMALSIDLARDLSNVNLQAEFAYVVIHEFGHVLTLNPSQVNVQTESSCQTYFTGEGCSKENSYINRLFEIGWEDIIDQYGEEDADRLYRDYPDRFVSDYASTNPGEDIAEVFTTYVIEDDLRTDASIASQKIRMLDGYSELVSLRKMIRQVPAVSLITKSHMTRKKSKFRLFN